ncbi:NADH-quinone oxidoreductase subunit A [bacterium CPR1]|nr:NADH-quinone oxidoreductase subunit A [bacterium CPR1]
MIGVAVVIATVLSALTLFFGPKRPTAAKLAPYECGLTELAPLPERFPVKFLQIAMLFLIFDVEAVALYPLAMVLRQTGISALIDIMIFCAVLLLGYAYVWRKGAFKWTF